MIMIWNALIVVIFFWVGSLMFSYWLGLLTQHNLHTIGDGNPGAANLWKASGFKWGILGVVLDFSKGYLPILFLIHYGGVSIPWMVLASLALIAGHIFSPFLRFKGGKGTAVTFGVWSGLTHFEVSILFAVILAVLKLATSLLYKGTQPSSKIDSLHAIWGFVLIPVYLLFRGFSYSMLLVWLGNWLLILYANQKKRLVNNQHLGEELSETKEESPLFKSN